MVLHLCLAQIVGRGGTWEFPNQWGKSSQGQSTQLFGGFCLYNCTQFQHL